MRKTISFIVGLLMGIILTVGSIIGIPLYLLNSKSLNDVEDMTGADFGLFEDQVDEDGVMDMSILSLIGYTAGLLEGDENGKLTLEDLSTKLGFSAQLPTEFQELYTLDLKSMSDNPDQVSQIIMDSITVDMIMSMSNLDANDGSFGSMLAGISDMSLSSILGGVNNLPIGLIAGVVPNEYYAEDSAIVTYYKNHIGYTTPVVSESPDDLNDLLRKLLFKPDSNGEYIVYIQPTGDGAYAYLKYEMLHVTSDTARYDLVDGEYKLLKNPDTTDPNLYVKVRGNYLTVEDATALYTLYASAPRYNATDISAMSDMQSVVGDLTLGDLASLMGLEEMALLESLMGYTIEELGSNPDIFEDIEIAVLLGDEIADTMISNILLKKMTTTPIVGDKVWVDIAGVKTYIQLTSDNIDDYSEYYQSITLGELSDGAFSDITLAQLLPDVEDELLIKVLYRELESDYVYSEGETIYYRGSDGKMVEVVYQDSTSIPSGEIMYKALTISELTSGGIDIASIVQGLEVAGFLGDEIADDIMKNILFTKTTTPMIGDEIWVDVDGVMTLVTVDQDILDTYSVFYRSLTIGELADSSFEDIALATFMPDVDNEVLLKVLYREIEGEYVFEEGEVFYIKGTDGKMVEIVYQDSTSIPSGETLYLAVTLGELSQGIDMEAILNDIQIATLLGDEIADEMLSKILFEKLPTPPTIGEKTWVDVDGVMTLVTVDSDILSTYTVYYRAITVSELTDGAISNMTLATFMPDLDDDILIKVLYREVESDYEYVVGETVYVRGSDGKMIEIVYQDSTSIPAGETIYKALTFSEFVNGDIDVNAIVQELEVAGFLGDAIEDEVMKNLIFTKTTTPTIGDKTWVDIDGVMTLVTVDQDILDGYSVFYRSLTIAELADSSFEDVTLATFMPDVDNEVLLKVLYREVESEHLFEVGDIFYIKGVDGKMIEVVYQDSTSIPSGETLYLAVTLGELSKGIDMEAILKDLQIATLLGDEIADEMLSKILFEKLPTPPTIGEKTWVDIDGVMTLVTVDSDILSTYTVYYRDITVSELTDEDMSSMTLATFMPEADDDILLKVLYREVESGYEYVVGETIYYRGSDGKMVEIVYQDSTSIPEGEKVYKALTFSQFISEGIDVESILQEIEVAPLMGEGGVSDALFVEIIFDRLDNSTLKVGDEVYRLESGTMKSYVIQSDSDLVETNLYYKSKTVSELMNMQLENLEIVKFVSDSADDLMVAILYTKVQDNSTLSIGEVVYYKDADVMVEAKYNSSMSSMNLYKGVSIKDFAQVDITERVKGIDIAQFLMNGDMLADETLMDIIFSELTDSEYLALGAYDTVYYRDLAGIHKTTKGELDALNGSKPDSQKYVAYKSMTLLDFASLDMSDKVRDMELARYLLDEEGVLADDILSKLLFVEADSEYISTLGSYDNVYVETTYGIKRVPYNTVDGQVIYRALTVSELTEGVDVNKVLEDMEIASLIGEEGVEDALLKETVFDKVDNSTLNVGDKAYRLESGVMKSYIIADDSDLVSAKVYYRSKTVSEFLNTDLDDMAIVKFMSNSADDLIVAILYDKVDNDTLTDGDTVYYKSGDVMVETKYNSSMSSISLYKAITIKDFGSVNITERVKNLSVVEFLSSDGKVTDETLIELIFEEIPAIDLEAMNSEDVVYYKGEDGMYESTKGQLGSGYVAYKAMTLLDFASLDMSAKVKEIEIARYLADSQGIVSGDLIGKMLFRQVDSEYLSSLGIYDKVYVKTADGMLRVSKAEVGSQTAYRSLTMTELSSIDIKDIVDDMQLIDLLDVQPNTMLAKIFMTKYSGVLVEGDYYYIADGEYVKYTYPSQTALPEGTVLYVALSASDMSDKMENLLIIDMVDVKPNTLMSALAYEELEGNMVEGTTYYYIQGDDYLLYTGTTLPDYPLYRPRAVKESADASENLLVRDVINVTPGSLMSNVAYAEVDVLEAGHTYYYILDGEYAHFNYTGVEDYSALGQMYKAEKMKDMPSRMANLSLTDVLGEPERKDFYGDGVMHYTSIWAIFEKEDGTIDDIKLANLDNEISARINIENITLGTLERLQGEVIEGLDENDRNTSVKILIDFYTQYKDMINNMPQYPSIG